ncbi:hypothetical protein VWM68_10115, partial [Campylobacter coli]
IDGLGENIVELLFKEKKINTLESIFHLKFSDFEGLEGFKEKKGLNSQDKNAVLKAQKKIEKQDENQAQKEIANASENSKFKNESL